MAIIDTSVYIASIDPAQPFHASAQRWMTSAIARGERIAAPWIIAPEVGSAIGRNTGDPVYAQAAVNYLTRAGAVDLVPVGPALAQRAAAIAAAQQVKGCDAIFVALAAEMGDTLVTLDKQQAARAAAVVAVHQPN